MCLRGVEVKKTHRSVSFFSIANFNDSCRTKTKLNNSLVASMQLSNLEDVNCSSCCSGVESQLLSASVDTSPLLTMGSLHLLA